MDSSIPDISSNDPKTLILNQVRAEAAMTNARELLNKLNHNCFEKCIPSPQSSLSKKDEQCFTMCMEKYLAAWNAVSRAYVNKIPKGVGAAGAGGAGGHGESSF